MAESYFSLSDEDRAEVLELGRERTGRPAHLLEKDIWVVWTLGALFGSPVGSDLTFKGGTSLSKAYRIIDRFSEDLDLTYDIRKLIADLTRSEEFLPTSRSQASKWTKAVRDRLPDWIAGAVQPAIQAALEHVGDVRPGGQGQRRVVSGGIARRDERHAYFLGEGDGRARLLRPRADPQRAICAALA